MQSGDLMGRLSVPAFDGTNWPTFDRDARLDFLAIENFGTAAHGSKAILYVVPAGGTVTTGYTFEAGSLTFGGTLTPGSVAITAGSITGMGTPSAPSDVATTLSAHS